MYSAKTIEEYLITRNLKACGLNICFYKPELHWFICIYCKINHSFGVDVPGWDIHGEHGNQVPREYS